jgi:hypothetical protein
MLVVLGYQTFVGRVQWVASQALTMKNPLKIACTWVEFLLKGFENNSAKTNFEAKNFNLFLSFDWPFSILFCANEKYFFQYKKLLV